MKIINKEKKGYIDTIETYYDFDKLRTLEDLKEICNLFTNSGINILGVTIKELGDYDDAPKNRGYDTIEELLENFERDFDENSYFSQYGIIGEVGRYTANASIYPNENRLLMIYSSALDNKIENMFRKYEQEKKTIR